MDSRELTKPLLCFKCGKQTESVDNPPNRIPYKGTIFDTVGHYGSTYIDLMPRGDHLEILICDDCLFAADPETLVMVHTKTTREFSFYTYDPNE